MKNLKEIDDAIDRWHNSDSELNLHEYLSLTWREYILFAGNPDEFEKLLKKREKKNEGIYYITRRKI